MLGEGLQIKLKAVVKLEKYNEDVLIEDIKNNKIEPLEVIYSVGNLFVTEKEYKDLGGI